MKTLRRAGMVAAYCACIAGCVALPPYTAIPAG